ncbi:MAG: NAD(P)/FAD-dependent oxidoreductase [Lachnospiraceae bacterium]|nr:NAD(P)/FAD-dependent oxidoreductase [Lachnospiraceae bacterium]
MFDVVVVGAGVIGCAIARFLTQYEGRFCVIEKGDDVCCGTSKANSAIVHAGYDAAEGSLKAKYNVLGNAMMAELSEELDFPFQRIGSLVVGTDEKSMPVLEALYERGIKNGVSGMKIVCGDELRKLEPNVSENAVAALYASTAGIVCPFNLTIALAENAAENGAEFRLNTTVKGLEKSENGWIVKTDKGDIETKIVVNAAGVFADNLHNMVSAKKISITARKGEYYLLDKSQGKSVSHTIFQLPTNMGKGILITPTVHGNLLVGPTATDVESKENLSTTALGYEELNKKANLAVNKLNLKETITSFAGLRAHETQEDFIIGFCDDAEGFFDCAGIESPGLASSPAIGKDVAAQVAEKLGLDKKKNYKSTRKGIINPEQLSLEERKDLIKKNPSYGKIICRCESITEGEIIDAATRIIPARNLDAVKRRVRAGMGRCQGGFCSPRVMEILAETQGCKLSSITKKGPGSEIVLRKEAENDQ